MSANREDDVERVDVTTQKEGDIIREHKDKNTPSEIKEVNTTNILCKISDEDAKNEDLPGQLKVFAKARNLNSLCLTKTGDLIMKGNSNIKLHSGMKTLQQQLKLKHTPNRVTDMTPLPDRCLQQYFANGYDEASVLAQFGKLFQAQAVQACLDKYKNRKRNCVVLETSTPDLIRDGTIPIEKAMIVECNKQAVKRYKREHHTKPRLDWRL